MNVLVVEPMKKPYQKDIDSGLHSLQHEVGGYIEATYPYEDLVGLICNEEGKLNGLPLNRAIYGEDGEMVDIIAGTFLIVGLSEDNFAELPKELAEKYTKLFETPEIFYSADGQIHVQQVKPSQTEAEHQEITESSDITSQRRFSIYQLKRSDELHDIRFEPFNHLEKNGIPCDIRNYDLVYSGRMRPHETLENLFYKFNTEHPKDFRGHSLSVSDVVVIRERGKSTAYYVDSVGFKQLDHFEKSRAKTRENREARDFER
ncbi:MAG: DUF3846 domain-containing protein [Christensenellales bacterium]|jgi:hypothetical protein